jgi:hypothetical protein
MKTYFVENNHSKFVIFYDKHLRLWTSYEIDLLNNQISDTDYWRTKNDAINYLTQQL